MPTLEQWKTNLKNDNPTLNKMVNGELIALSPDEYSKTIDEWAQNSFNQQQENDVRENGGASANYAAYRRGSLRFYRRPARHAVPRFCKRHDNMAGPRCSGES